MEILGTKTAIKILDIILQDPLREFKEIEMIGAAETGKGSGATVINALVGEKILLEKRQGRTKLLSLNLKSNVAFTLKHLFSQNQLRNVSVSKRAAIFFFKKEAIEQSHLIILFGSTLAGTAKEESDIDVFLVPKDAHKIEIVRKKAEEVLGEQFNLHYCDKEQILAKVKDDPFIKNIIIKGYILAGYDFCRDLFSSIGKKENVERLLFLNERVNASLRNYMQKDHKTAEEILEKALEQLIFYILAEKDIPYTSKKDAESIIQTIPEGKEIEEIKKASLKEKISLTHDIIITILNEKILEGEGYGSC